MLPRYLGQTPDKSPARAVGVGRYRPCSIEVQINSRSSTSAIRWAASYHAAVSGFAVAQSVVFQPIETAVCCAHCKRRAAGTDRFLDQPAP
jgi:hypothetical protein